MASTTLELPSVSAPPRRRELLFGTAFATGGVVMVFVTLVGAYLNARGAAGPAWLADNPIPLTQPNMMMGTLAMSAVTMQWAVWSIDRDDRAHTYLALGITLMFGAAYVNQLSFLYSQAGITMSQPAGPLFYAISGGHLAMVVAAMVFIVLMGFRALGGQFSSRQPDGIGAAAVLWHAAVAVYALIWIAVYILK